MHPAEYCPDFDFQRGSWRVRHRRLKARLAGCTEWEEFDGTCEQRPILGGRRGHHSEHLGHLLAVMQFLPRTYPDAVW